MPDQGANIFGDAGDIDDFRRGFQYGDVRGPLTKFLGRIFNAGKRQEIAEAHQEWWTDQNERLSQAGYKWDKESQAWKNPNAPTELSMVMAWEDIDSRVQLYKHQHPEFDVVAFFGPKSEEPATLLGMK